LPIHFLTSSPYNVEMRIRILGSAAGGGFPQWNCNCHNCKGYCNGSIRAKRRTQSSIAVTADDSNWVLFNASPDILTQLHDFRKTRVDQNSIQIRNSFIRSIVLIDSQIDHTTGLLMLRESNTPLQIYCTDAVQEDLTTGNPLFEVLSHYSKVDWHPIRFDRHGQSVFEIEEMAGLRFTAYPLKSKAPPYSPRRKNPSGGETIGVMIEDLRSGKKMFYAPGLGEMESSLASLLADSDGVLVDGTFWSETEMRDLGIADKSARSMGHLPQSGPGGMLEVLSSMKKPRKILIHINNTNPILNEDSPERAILTQKGIEVSEDGMEIEL